MFRSFFAKILLLQCFTIFFITVGYYSPYHQKKQTRLSTAARKSKRTGDDSQSEVTVFWTPENTSSESSFSVIRKNVRNGSDERLLATIDPSDDLFDQRYLKVSDPHVNNGEYSYQVVQITPKGTQVIASLAYVIPKTASSNICPR